MTFRNVLYKCSGKTIRFINRVSNCIGRDSHSAAIFSTALQSDNLGDAIIMKYCDMVLAEILGSLDRFYVSTHAVPDKAQTKNVSQASMKFVCGTNLLTSHVERWWNWRLPDGLIAKLPFRNAVLLGAGWDSYQDECSVYSQMVYQSVLNPNVLHSVRDQYTADKLKAAGIHNVINTGCPTMWNLTPDFCAQIPKQKATDVVTTVTDYRRNQEHDNTMLNILSRNYRNVYLWLQGRQDEAYLQELELPSNLVIIPRSLDAYEQVLSRGNIDYVGTRLHAGIYALNHKVRSLVISVDNRAIEIARDTKLPIIGRDEMGEILEQSIHSAYDLHLKIPMENIEIFKKQFVKG